MRQDACPHACVTLRLVTVPGVNFPAKNAEIGAIPGKLGYFRSVRFERKSASNRWKVPHLLSAMPVQARPVFTEEARGPLRGRFALAAKETPHCTFGNQQPWGIKDRIDGGVGEQVREQSLSVLPEKPFKVTGRVR